MQRIPSVNAPKYLGLVKQSDAMPLPPTMYMSYVPNGATAQHMMAGAPVSGSMPAAGVSFQTPPQAPRPSIRRGIREMWDATKMHGGNSLRRTGAAALGAGRGVNRFRMRNRGKLGLVAGILGGLGAGYMMNQPGAPQPAAPQPAAPQVPAAPQPAAPQPVAPQPVAPQPQDPFGVSSYNTVDASMRHALEGIRLNPSLYTRGGLNAGTLGVNPYSTVRPYLV